MKPEDLLNWRKTLGYTQEEAGQKLGVDRSTIQNWERGVTRVPRIMELACRELTRRWKQRPEFGPVALVCADEPMRPKDDYPTRAVFVQCELYPNNEVAIRRTLRLEATGKFVNPLIIDQDGGIVWSTPDLLRECDRRRETARPQTKRSGPEPSKAKIKRDKSNGRSRRRGRAAALKRAKK
jgi:DNA-binding XRE family transcriptional regulator